MFQSEVSIDAAFASALTGKMYFINIITTLKVFTLHWLQQEFVLPMGFTAVDLIG